MDTNNVSSPGVDIPDKKKIAILSKQVNRLRAAIYISVAILILFGSLSLFWIYNYYTESPFETYYSTPSQPPKALLYLSPKEGNYNAGQEFSIDIIINTAGSNVNAVAAYLSYNKNKMEAVSIDISGSVFDIPIEQLINEKDGKIKIGLAKPTPGINTYNGKVATVRFKALKKTPIPVENIYFDFTKGSDLYSGVFLNDKKGTNILDAVRGAKIFVN